MEPAKRQGEMPKTKDGQFSSTKYNEFVRWATKNGMSTDSTESVDAWLRSKQPGASTRNGAGRATGQATGTATTRRFPNLPYFATQDALRAAIQAGKVKKGQSVEIPGGKLTIK